MIKIGWKSNIKSAMTLAEVLITLLIIGVVSAFTIPTLVNNIEDAQYKTAWKKEYSILSQAFSQIVNDNGGSIANVFPGNAAGSEELKNAFAGKLSFIKNCSGTGAYGGTGSGAYAEGCWYSVNDWWGLNGKYNTGWSPLTSGLVLKDGTIMYIMMSQSDCNQSVGDYTRCGTIYVDVNGLKKPNTSGRDVFGMCFTQNILIPKGARGVSDPDTTCIKGNTASTNTGDGCAAKYLYE